MESSGLRARSMILLAFATIWTVWGSTYLAIAIAIETLPPFAMASVRFLLAGALVGATARLRGAAWPRARQWAGAGAVGTLMLAGGNGLVTWAEASVPSSVAALLITTVPLWMTVLDGALHGGSRPRARTWVGLLIGVTGVVVLVRPSADEVHGLPVWGVTALLLAAFSWANGSLLARRVPAPPSPAMSIAAQMLIGGSVLGLAAVLRGEPADIDPATVSARSVGAFVYLVIFGSIAGLSAYHYLLRRVSPSAVSTYAFVNPVVAVALGWFVAHEPIDARVLGAGGLIVTAVAVILGPTRRRARPTGSIAVGVPTGGQSDEGKVHAEA